MLTLNLMHKNTREMFAGIFAYNELCRDYSKLTVAATGK